MTFDTAWYCITDSDLLSQKEDVLFSLSLSFVLLIDYFFLRLPWLVRLPLWYLLTFVLRFSITVPLLVLPGDFDSVKKVCWFFEWIDSGDLIKFNDIATKNEPIQCKVRNWYTWNCWCWDETCFAIDKLVCL